MGAARNKTNQPHGLVELACNAHVALSISTYIHILHLHIYVPSGEVGISVDMQEDTRQGVVRGFQGQGGLLLWIPLQ